jgi:hypothetical protein
LQQLPPPEQATSQEIQQNKDDANDVDEYDNLPFTDEVSLPENEDDMFFDTLTWSEDEEGVIHVTAPL